MLLIVGQQVNQQYSPQEKISHTYNFQLTINYNEVNQLLMFYALTVLIVG